MPKGVLGNNFPGKFVKPLRLAIPQSTNGQMIFFVQTKFLNKDDSLYV